MKKITAAFDGLKFSNSTKEYAVFLAKQTNAHLVGVSLEDITYSSYKIYDLIGEKGVSQEMMNKLEKKDKETRVKSVESFEQACRKAALNYSVHRDKNIAIQELLHESIYTDLLVIDAKETLTHYTEKLPTRFIRNLLVDVQCPVLLAPRQYKPISKIVLLYDGAPSSVHAIKMFSYMFPALKHLLVEVLSVKAADQSQHLPDNTLMKEFMKRHFPKAVYKVLKGVPETEIMHYLKGQGQDILIVLGAYRRGMVSRWFRSSMADALMQDIKAPLFIAHNK